MRSRCGDVEVIIDERGNLRGFSWKSHDLVGMLPDCFWELEGNAAEVAAMSEARGVVSLMLSTKESEARLSVACSQDEAVPATGEAPGSGKGGNACVRLHLSTPTGEKPGQVGGAEETAVSGRFPRKLGFTLGLPTSTRFHLPERYNVCRVLDASMPVHDLHSCDLGYGFLIVEVEGMHLLFHLEQTGTDAPSATLARHPSLFSLTLCWNPEHDLLVSMHETMEEAMEYWHRAYCLPAGIRRLRDDPSIPDWVRKTRLVITLDMMRSNWQIAHDYADVTRLADELGRIGCPKETLFYLPGSNGAYDSTYPDHGPHPELGGADGFASMIESLHRNGFRLMLHANAWGVDPCHPEIDRYLPYVLKNPDGSYEGWQTGGTLWGGQRLPPSYPLKFRTGRSPVFAASGGPSPKGNAPTFTFRTVPVPDSCEALLTFGTGYRGPGRFRISINHRTYITPPGWFASHDSYAFPFPFLLFEGENEATVECPDDWVPADAVRQAVQRAAAAPSDAESMAVSGESTGFWYEVRDSFSFLSGCTYPILRADTTNPEWIRIFLDKIGSVVNEYDIDAVHVDATHYHRDATILEALRREMPDCVLSGEELGSPGDIKVYAFCQNAELDLLAGIERRRLAPSRTYLPDRKLIEARGSWLRHPSPVLPWLGAYVRLYPHLCRADGFVPTAKVCNIRPPVKEPPDSERLWNALRDAGRLGYIPGLRLNYREYGLDADSKRFIREIAAQ